MNLSPTLTLSAIRAALTACGVPLLLLFLRPLGQPPIPRNTSHLGSSMQTPDLDPEEEDVHSLSCMPVIPVPQ